MTEGATEEGHPQVCRALGHLLWRVFVVGSVGDETML